MKLSTRVLLASTALTVVFAAVIGIVLYQYSSQVAVASTYTQEMQPAQLAIEHLLTTIYGDFLLVEEYLLVTNYSELLQLDTQLEHSEEQCEAITEELDGMIDFNAITDQTVIDNYQTALVVYSSWQRSRDTLLSLHKESVATNVRKPRTLAQEHERFVTLMKNSTAYLGTSLQQLNAQNAQLQADLNNRTKSTQVLLVALLVTFILVSIISSQVLIRKITRPLDNMSATSIAFTKGDYKARVKETSSVSEIGLLQSQLNRVYGLIDSTFKTKEQKSLAASKLLPNQFKDILEFISLENQKGRAPTIKDVKKEFNLTHPTTIARLRHLEDNGYVVMRKQGRNKCIFEA